MFMADTRTNAGVDTIATGRKLHSWAVRGKARALDPGRAAQTEMQIGQIVTDTIATQSQGADKAMQATFGATMLVGGQIHGSAPGLFLIYPKGNFTEASEDTPLLVIGVTKYGKPFWFAPTTQRPASSRQSSFCWSATLQPSQPPCRSVCRSTTWSIGPAYWPSGITAATTSMTPITH